jgi:toxin HigB-1
LYFPITSSFLTYVPIRDTLAVMEFKDRGTEDIYDGLDSKAARRTLPSELHQAATDLLDSLDNATKLADLVTPGNRLHKLGGDRAGQHSLSINKQYRICFTWTDQGATDVEITDYH